MTPSMRHASVVLRRVLAASSGDPKKSSGRIVLYPLQLVYIE